MILIGDHKGIAEDLSSEKMEMEKLDYARTLLEYDRGKCCCKLICALRARKPLELLQPVLFPKAMRYIAFYVLF